MPNAIFVAVCQRGRLVRIGGLGGPVFGLSPRFGKSGSLLWIDFCNVITRRTLRQSGLIEKVRLGGLGRLGGTVTKNSLLNE